MATVFINIYVNYEDEVDDDEDDAEDDDGWLPLITPNMQLHL